MLVVTTIAFAFGPRSLFYIYRISFAVGTIATGECTMFNITREM